VIYPTVTPAPLIVGFTLCMLQSMAMYRLFRNDWTVTTGTGHPADYLFRLTQNDTLTNSCRMRNTSRVVRDGDTATFRLSFLYTLMAI